jgi:hypothetical protein
MFIDYNLKCESTSHTDDSSLLGCDNVSLAKRFLTFWSIMLPSAQAETDCYLWSQKTTEEYMAPTKQWKDKNHHTPSTPIQSSMMPVVSGSSCTPTCYRQTQCPSPRFFLAQLSTQLFHMTNLHTNVSKDICPWPQFLMDENKALCIHLQLWFWYEIFKITPN